MDKEGHCDAKAFLQLSWGALEAAFQDENPRQPPRPLDVRILCGSSLDPSKLCTDLKQKIPAHWELTVELLNTVALQGRDSSSLLDHQSNPVEAPSIPSNDNSPSRYLHDGCNYVDDIPLMIRAANCAICAGELMRLISLVPDESNRKRRPLRPEDFGGISSKNERKFGSSPWEGGNSAKPRF